MMDELGVNGIGDGRKKILRTVGTTVNLQSKTW